MVFQENSQSPRCLFPSQALEQKDWPTYLSASRSTLSQHTDTSRSGWHLHPSVLHSLSPISVFPLPVSILLLRSQLSPISRAHRSQINLFDSQIFNPDVKCIAREVGGTAKTLTQKVWFEKHPAVLKACLGYEAVEAVDLQWVKGHQAGRKKWRKYEVGQNEPGYQCLWITTDLLVFNN